MFTQFMQFLSSAGDVQIPGPPSNVHASEVSRTYVVLSWDPPTPRGKEPLMYFIEKVIWVDTVSAGLDRGAGVPLVSTDTHGANGAAES